MELKYPLDNRSALNYVLLMSKKVVFWLAVSVIFVGAICATIIPLTHPNAKIFRQESATASTDKPTIKTEETKIIIRITQSADGTWTFDFSNFDGDKAAIMAAIDATVAKESNIILMEQQNGGYKIVGATFNVEHKPSYEFSFEQKTYTLLFADYL
jgi:hypothetical protein